MNRPATRPPTGAPKDHRGDRGPAGPADQGPGLWRDLLPAVLGEDPDEAAVTDALLEAVDLPAELGRLVTELADLLEQSTAASTRRAYTSDWASFRDWTERHQLSALPADPRTVALYVTAQQERLRPATLLRRLSAINLAHRTAAHPSPTGHELVRRAVAGLRRSRGGRPAGKSALVTAQLAAICSVLHAKQT
ncbi:MAG: hypothetical protein M4D85_07710, partial [Actinomycetota bacterium]|nr:hypothetical protein [Actinomycetota bacterium]